MTENANDRLTAEFQAAVRKLRYALATRSGVAAARLEYRRALAALEAS